MELNGEIVAADKNWKSSTKAKGLHAITQEETIDREDEGYGLNPGLLFKVWGEEEELSLLFCQVQHWHI